MTKEEKIEQLNNSIDKLTNKFEAFAIQSEKRELEQKQNKSSKSENNEPWWATLIKFIGLPAALLALVVSFKQSDNISANTNKVNLEADKIKLESLEKSLLLLSDSISVQKIQTLSDRQKIKKEVNEINTIVSQIRDIKTSNNINVLISKFIIIYLFFIATGLFFRIFNFFWYNFFSIVHRFLIEKWRKIKWKTNEEKDREKYERRIQYFDWGITFLNTIPSIIHILFDFILITFVVIPLFNDTSSDLNSRNTFTEVSNSLLHLDFIKAVQTLKDIVFNNNTGSARI